MNKASESPINILTKGAQETVRKATALTNDFIMLGAIKDVDLISG